MRHLKDNFKRFQIPLSLLLFSIIGWFFFTFRIVEVPPGINGDEAALGYNAALVARTGHDQSGRFLPLFVSAQDLTDWKQPITFYSTVLLFKLFGPSYFLLRAVSVLFVLASSTLIFILGKDLMGWKGAFIALSIFISIPIILIQSHLALENIAPVPFITLWLIMFVKYKKTLNQKFLVLAGLSLGVSLYTYPGIRLIFPILSLLTILFIFYINWKNGNELLTPALKFSLVVGIFPLIMLLIKGQYPGAILAYNRPTVVTTYQDFMLPYLSFFDPSFLFIKGDTTPYHSTGKQGVFLLATLPLFALGIFKIAQKKDLLLNFILLTFFIAPLLYGLTGSGSIHRGSRLLVLLPAYTIVASVGLLAVSSFKNKFFSLALTALLISLVILNYMDFVRDFWYEYPNRVKSDFAKPIHQAFERLYNESKYNNSKPFIQTDFTQQNVVAFNFFEQVYFPDKLPTWTIGQDVPESSVILVNNPSSAQNLKNLKIIDIEGTEWFLLVNSSKN